MQYFPKLALAAARYEISPAAAAAVVNGFMEDVGLFR